MSNEGKLNNRAKGGIARAQAMTSEERKKIARKAAAGRWGYKATHKGNFQEEFGINVDCYVLNDEQKTAVISQRGMGEALGLGEGGSRLPTFIKGQKIAPYIGHELREKLGNPLVFQGGMVGTTTVHGYDVTILIDVCKAIITAHEDGKLLQTQQHIAKQARIILNASAKAGIKGLVYALSGYDATREEFIAAFKTYVLSEAREYEKEFPNDLYSEWYRIYNLQKPDRGRPWNFKYLTIDQVYTILAKSNGKILELTRENKDNCQKQNTKLHQFLSEVGVKALRQHLGALLGIAKISDTREEYERHITKAFGGQQRFHFEK
jgi:hypothetical protein